MNPLTRDYQRLELNFFKLGVVGIVSLVVISSTLCRPLQALVLENEPVAENSTSIVDSSLDDGLDTTQSKVQATLGTFEGSIAREWKFGSSDDLKSDGWPDDWIRRTGVGFPKYTQIKISRETTNKSDLDEIERLRRGISQIWIGWEQGKFPWLVTPEAAPPLLDAWLEETILNSFLQMELDGNAAEVASPVLAVEPEYQYGLQCQARLRMPTDNRADPSHTSHSEGILKDYRIWGTLRLLDSNRKLLVEQSTELLSQFNNWDLLNCRFETDTATPVAFAQIVLNAQPTSKRAGNAIVDFDSVRLVRFPKLTLQQKHSAGIYIDESSVEITVITNPFPDPNGFARLRITDHTGKLVHEERIDPPNNTNSQKRNVRNWSSSSLEPGYYEAKLEYISLMASASSAKVQPFVVVSPSEEELNKNFGLVLTEIPLENEKEILGNLRSIGAANLKIPVFGMSAPFSDASDSNTRGSLDVRALIDRIESLQRDGFSVTGMLGPAIADNSGSLSLLQLLSNRIGQFQFGADSDTMLRNSPAISSQLESLRESLRELNQNAQFVQVTDPVDLKNWSAPLESSSVNAAFDGAATQPRDIHQLSSKLELTANEVRGLATDSKSRLWYSVTPLPKDIYSTEVRIDDLLERMLLAIDPSVPAETRGWVQKLLDSQRGLLNKSGQPTAMFVPFKTLAQTFNGSQAIGDLNDESLPAHQLIARGNELSLLLWGGEPATIDMYLGEEIQVRDIWGRAIQHTEAMTAHGLRQTFNKDRYPLLVRGLDAPAARWRRGLTLITESIPVRTAGDSIIEVEFSNTEDVPVQGKLRVESSIFAMQPSEVTFNVDQRANLTVPVTVRLNPFTTTGPEWIRITAEIDQKEKPVFVSVERKIQVGSKDIEAEVDYYFDENGNLVVDLDLHKSTGSLGKFDCYVSAPGRTRKRAQFASNGNHAHQKFVFNSPSDLIGQTIWIQLEQLTDNLMINKRIAITNQK